MRKVMTWVTCSVIVLTVLCASAGIRPNIGVLPFREASQHIANASPTGNADSMSFIAFYFEASGNAWSIWEKYSNDGTFAVRVKIPDSPIRYAGETAVFRADIERKSATNPLDPWRKIAIEEIRINSSQDVKEIQGIYSAMGEGVFGLSSASPTAVATNIALKTAEVTATTQFKVWNACLDALFYIMGFSQSVDE